jgi:organic hydroperoxide reductase OsmC/OhrA
MARIRQRGTGKLTTQSNTLANTQYSFKSRFEDGVGTNPEELIAAAFLVVLQCNFQHLLERRFY